MKAQSMPDQTSRDEVRKKIQDFAVRYYEALADDDYKLAEKLTLEQLDVITQNRQSLIDQIKAELGEKKTGWTLPESEYARGHNDMHDKVIKILEGIK